MSIDLSTGWAGFGWFERVLGKHSDESSRETVWNLVTLGDGRKARLVPRGVVNRIREADGHYSCDHGEIVCSQNDRAHETVSLYMVEVLDA